MSELVGKAAPDFTVLADDNTEVSLHDFKGKKVILYFYPKDNTPGCSVEAQNFNEAYDTLAKAGYTILGVSRDTVKRHVNFKEKFGLRFALLADTDRNERFVRLQVRRDRACSHMGLKPYDGVADIVIMRHLRLIKEYYVLKLR